jgi:hypothetical protein
LIAVINSFREVPRCWRLREPKTRGFRLALGRVSKGMKEVAFVDGAGEDAVLRRT